MRLWWWLLLDTERAFPIKQKLFSVYAKKTQYLLLTMVVPIKWMKKYNEENEKNYLRTWKVKQRKLTVMKTWIRRQGITLFVPIHPLFRCFPVLISNHLASILKPYLLAYSELCQTSKIESFARMVMRRNSFPVENL